MEKQIEARVDSVLQENKLKVEECLKKAKAKKTRVCAFITLETGETYAGINIESSCHSLSICAERMAVYAAVNDLGPGIKVKDVLIYAEREGKPVTIIPCGGCRQILAEYGTPDTLVQNKPMSHWLPEPYL